MLGEVYPTYIQPASHKAVRKDFAPAPKFQMTHSDSVLAGISLDSCLLVDVRELSARPATGYLLIASPCARQEGETELAC